MMRGQRSMAVAVRSPSGQVHVTTKPISNSQTGIRRVPFLRGVVVLVESLVLGVGALFESANISLGEEDQKISGPLLWGTLLASFAFAAALFFVMPLLITGSLIDPHINSSVLSNLVEGVIRVVIFIAYLALVNLIPDIRTVFAYHGAEHKTINAFEAGAELKPEIVANYPIEHARCGTAFLLTLVILSILVFSLLGPMPMFWRLASRILLIPVLAGIAVEYIRWTANHLDWAVVRWMIKPNLALQSLTTREPDTAILEVAIASFNAMRQAEKELVT